MKSNRIVSVIFLLISGWFWAESIHVPYKDALFPRLMALLLIVLSLILFTETFLKQGQLVEQKPALTRRNLIYMILIISLAFAWLYMMNIFGFATSSIVFLLIMTLILSTKAMKFRETLFTLILYAVIVIGFWFAFSKLLLIPLPHGFLI
jgi:hypothetical protein